MNYMSYFNFLCKCIDTATQLYLDGKDKGYALCHLLERLCVADSKAHILSLYYKAIARCERDDWRVSLNRKFDEALAEMLGCRGYYYVINPRRNTLEEFRLEDLRRLTIIHKVLLNRAERAMNESEAEEKKGNFKAANKYYYLSDLLDDCAEDIFAAIHGEDIEC